MLIKQKNCRKLYSQGFTLIELLVVVSIIGLLSAIVLASVNSAKAAAQVANIKSNLKSIIPQAELAYDTPGNFSTVCSDPKVVNVISTISKLSNGTSCFSYNNAGFSDSYLRWGISTIKIITTPLSAHSASQNGVNTWDSKGVNSSGSFVTTDITMTWSMANNACALSNGRLPTLEELKTLSDATWILSSNTTHTPPSFAIGDYWSSTAVPSTTSTAYVVAMSSGNISTNLKTVFNFVRCVR